MSDLVQRLRAATLYKCDTCPEEICCHPADDIMVCDDGVFCGECMSESDREDGVRADKIEAAALAPAMPGPTKEENDGLEHCGNFSATDLITDEDRIDYWKGAYERMAERNFRLNNALRQIRDQHIPDQPSAYGGSEFDWVVRQYANLRRIAKDAVEG